MTKLKIVRMRIENFKCHKLLEFRPEGGSMAIFGDNAAGKTSVYDALTWLLFGKDSSGNGEKNIEIKPLDANGAVEDHSAITSVEAEILCDAERVFLKRTYQEVWSTKRGSSTETFEGNTSEYYVDGVPCKKFAFDAKIRNLVPEDTFRLLTSVSYFAKDMSWQKRREVLFDMAGTMSDREIMESASQFTPLLEGMGKLSLEDYKKKLQSEKRGFTNAKTDIPARISECQKTIEDIQGLDFIGAKAELETLQAKQDSISAQIVAMEHDSAADQKRVEIRETQLELNKLEMENQLHRDNQIGSQPNVHSLNIRLTALQTQLPKKRDALSGEKEYSEYMNKQINDSRSLWIAVNGKTFTGATCPTCGQNLPAAQMQTAMAEFENSKQNRLREIERTANSHKEAKLQSDNRIARQQEEIQQMETEMAEIRAQIAAAETAKVEPVDMEHYAENAHSLNEKIQKLSGELADMMINANAATEKLRMKKTEISGQIAAQQAIISKESLLAYSRERIESLREDAKNAAECLEAIEKMLFLIDEYTRYKTRVVEEGVNSMFHIARFRLFREQANGGVEDRCDVTVDGVPYGSLNNGMRINVGIDIINALSRHYGVRVPLFVDNAESVTSLEKADTQVIRLVVSANDKKLRFEYEN